MDKIIYKKLKEEEINEELFSKFNRYQEVKRCWRKHEDKWRLENIPFIEQWSKEEYRFLVKCLKNTIRTKGIVVGAFNKEILIGFVSIESELFGAHKEYVQLSSIHVSYESRGRSIGKGLFIIAIQEAKLLGAKKLYISAHSSEESQAFYKAMGCVEAEEYNEEIASQEPCDCQLEFIL
ncbi:GNAT family N-acetyltransferase [Clostridium sp. 1001271B_151109_B4]|uniref:GNAT family N-acetyltransferase n=1 Tax=Clostridium sp. 1001271B_151109_B4 TaxID=2787148 RepID=UPI0018AAB213|nr:GNAT family N-acetyltransferase [Clostridium sp. 1001271B_151109_B4]